MKIKQLEIQGFKSFKNRTVIRFGKGISSIVGPNGCGKSNVVDAFLWVMGETTPRKLRSSSMEDLIFTGSEKTAAAGMAVVSLTMEVEDTDVFVAPYNSCSEIMITRRLDRDGKSDYLINSQICRLKDIQEIFMDTGSGVHGFSFIEQGAVERFISSKPEQKRLLIESAAGISKFRFKKKEAERKLALTNVNLKQFKDILSQQKIQLVKLQKQSQNAEQFRDLKKQIRDTDIQLWQWEFQNIQNQQQSLDQKIIQETKNHEDKTNTLIGISSRLEELKQQVEQKTIYETKYQTELTAVKQQVLLLEKDQSSLKASIEINKKDLSHQDSQGYKKNADIFLTKIEESKQMFIQLETTKANLYQKQKKVDTVFNQLNQQLSTLENQKQSLETQLINGLHQETLSQERTQFIFEKIKESEKHIQELKSLQTLTNKDIQKLKVRKITLSETLEQEKQLNFDIINSVQAGTKDVEAFKKQILTQENHLKLEQKEAATLHSEWDSLKKIGSRMDAQEKAIQFILQSREDKNTCIETAASIRVLSPMLEKTVSSYLEARLKSVFCLKPEEALSALDKLNQKRTGRGRFIFKNYDESSMPNKKILLSLQSEIGFHCFLKDKIEGNVDLINVLFNNVVVVEDIKAAFLLKKTYSKWCFLTLTGEVLTKEGDLIGGEFAKEEMNILTYRRAIKEMPIQYKKMTNKINVSENQLKKTKNLLQKSLDNLAILNKKESHFQISVLDINKDLESVNRDYNRLLLEVENMHNKILDYHNQIQKLQQKSKDLKQELSTTDTQNFTQKLKHVKLEYETQNQEKQIILQKKNQLWKEVMECEKKLSKVKETKKLLQQSLDNEILEQKKFDSRAQEKQILIKTDTHQLNIVQREYDVLSSKLKNTQSQLDLIVQQATDIKYQIDKDQTYIINSHQTLAEIQSSISNLKHQTESLSLQQLTVTERMNEMYKVDLNTLNNREWDLSQFNKEATKKDLKQMNRKLSFIGEVNFLALKEYEELVKENDFYQKQYEDLDSAKDKLNQVIRRIDKFCAQKFNEIFEQVNTCFSKVWPCMFDGGTAKLTLVKDPEKGIDGMEIMVCPPGKNIINMNLLSGGEKAMTAIAIIFSIFLVKPSPFCILDEVDAPLDDMNIYRFNSLLIEMAKVSQVIIVTHNKYTMRECNHLYGVTMEKKGISKLMSLDMKNMISPTQSPEPKNLI